MSRDEREKARSEPAPPPKRLTRLCVWFPADQMAALRVLAANKGRSETALVRDAVSRLLGLTKGQG